MTVEEIKTIAAAQGIKAGKMNKATLVRTIQEAERNTSCFGTGVAESCGQEGCRWREDCA
jgi:hypothetical protein